MQKSEIIRELEEIIYDYLGDEETEIKEDSVLTGDLGLTSLDLVSIVGDVENSFGITVEDEDIGTIETVGDIVEYVSSKIAV